MMLLTIIEKLYENKIQYIDKFNLYKLIKQVFIKEYNKFTYYKVNLIFNKLIKTKILIKIFENKKVTYKFNKFEKEQKRVNPMVVYFD